MLSLTGHTAYVNMATYWRVLQGRSFGGYSWQLRHKCSIISLLILRHGKGRIYRLG